jgi:very-short-patch-repair endonuclease
MGEGRGGGENYMEDRLITFARQLRINQTEAEKRLWKHLRTKQINVLKFRRQQPIGPYIVDFVCFKNKLIIELDGSQHVDNKPHDLVRDNWLRLQGFSVYRFWNNDVMNNIDGILRVVYDYCAKHHTLSPPIKGGGFKK